ncbi:4Fe-4S dicluster domain-containing protein [Desulfitobacterium chlororespirans]|uniref:Fe-S-cluster-containing dehydrogenase component n=1 Tax=Desulfitobacterium chlororespirans DSM 11544 TaxID=1121395 RepID=A0A1M7SJ70_9FIRM|nr:4Fe-4S dicluster domain-containing protein [Desulfitobacterium chlororespirans]SHN58545.1 Fe-S-cluster-containing dehydrogenase component [Desulfitobacterium chlororespirans DSM 11544]
MKVFVINIDKCVGCHGCQVGCKDEHCGNDWSPYAKPQPEIGQFWIKVNQQERGAKPHVKVTYFPVLCQHCDNAPCIKAGRGAVYKREDGLVLIDPDKAKGMKQLVDSCPYHAIYWNEQEQLPQKCTGCAHLLDGDHPISVPRCFDNCQVGAILFGEESEMDLQGTEIFHPEYGTKPRVYYRGLPKRFVAGTIYDPAAKEVIIGARCTLNSVDGKVAAIAETNNYGDFWLRNLPEDDFTLTVTAGKKTKILNVSTKEMDIGLGDVPLA